MGCERDLFARFGGVRPMAVLLQERPSTVQSWKNVGRIPATKQPDVLARAEEIGVRITAYDVVFPLNRRLDSDLAGEVVADQPETVACDRRVISHQAKRA
jgi:hypothetical protein